MNPYLLSLMILLFGWGARVKVIESTSQEWMGGLPESGYGTDYRITVRVGAGSGELRFEDLWIGDLHMKVRVMKDPAKPNVGTFEKGDRILVMAGMTTRPDEHGHMKTFHVDSLPRPSGYTGEGLLSYTLNGNVKYAEIKKLRELEKIIYP